MAEQGSSKPACHVKRNLQASDRAWHRTDLQQQTPRRKEVQQDRAGTRKPLMAPASTWKQCGDRATAGK